MNAPCSILIPTFNGKDILAECMPSIAEQVAGRGGIDEIIVIDNASTDGTGDFLQKEYPQARILTLEENKAIFALNDGAEAARNPYLFLLNNDMILKDDCIDALMKPFDDEDVFAVTGKVFQWDRTTVQAARRKPALNRGYFWPLEAETDEPGHTLYALGGQSVFARDKFLALGGIDPLFSPFYHEDLDLSWRALRRGWKVLYNPEAEMIHKGAATAGRYFTSRQIQAIMQKNLFLFMWKNLHAPGFVKSHVLWLLPRMMKETLAGNFTFAAGLVGALRQLPDAMRARSAARESQLSDADVLKIFE
ncbi:glycosyltransferase family 2 protein [bacterium]